MTPFVRPGVCRDAKHGETRFAGLLVVVHIMAGILTDSEAERLQLIKRRSCWERMIARNASQGRKILDPYNQLCAQEKG